MLCYQIWLVHILKICKQALDSEEVNNSVVIMTAPWLEKYKQDETWASHTKTIQYLKYLTVNNVYVSYVVLSKCGITFITEQQSNVSALKVCQHIPRNKNNCRVKCCIAYVLHMLTLSSVLTIHGVNNTTRIFRTQFG